jgi:hypothetical protein
VLSTIRIFGTGELSRCVAKKRYSVLSRTVSALLLITLVAGAQDITFTQLTRPFQTVLKFSSKETTTTADGSPVHRNLSLLPDTGSGFVTAGDSDSVCERHDLPA